MNRLRPKIVNIKMDKNRSESAEIPLTLTIVERKRVKKVKLRTNPATTPRGRLFPVVSAVEERIIGRIGRTQGERMVTIPARNAKVVRKSIYPPSRNTLGLGSWSESEESFAEYPLTTEGFRSQRSVGRRNFDCKVERASFNVCKQLVDFSAVPFC